MNYFHLILLPVLVAALPAILSKLRLHKYTDAIMLSAILVTVLANAIATRQAIINVHPGPGIYMLQAFLSCLIVPGCYTYFANALGIKVPNATMISTSLLVLLIFVPNICLFGPVTGKYLTTESDYIIAHSINVIWDGANVFHITIEGLVIVLQALIVLWRIVQLNIQMHRYELVYTNRVRLFIAWAVSCVLFAIIYHCTPALTWAGSAGAWLFLSIYVLLGVIGFLGIALNMEIKAVVTRDGAEAVQIDRFVESNRDLARQMRELFEKERVYLRQGLVIDDVVAMLGTNRTYFTRMMRLEFGMSFTEYVQKARVEFCKQRLRDSDDSVEDIAFDAGFGSASNLNRVFKKLVELTPEQYRTKKR